MVNMRTIKQGDVVNSGYRGRAVDGKDTFLGFSDVDNAYGDDLTNLPFKTLKEVHNKYGTRNVPALGAAIKDLDLPYGQGIYAVFENNHKGQQYAWAAYIFEGKFTVGTSADPIQFF